MYDVGPATLTKMKTGVQQKVEYNNDELVLDADMQVGDTITNPLTGTTYQIVSRIR